MFKVIFVLRSGTNSTPGEQGMLFMLTISSNFVSYLRILTKSLGYEVGEDGKRRNILIDEVKTLGYSRKTWDG